MKKYKSSDPKKSKLTSIAIAKNEVNYYASYKFIFQSIILYLIIPGIKNANNQTYSMAWTQTSHKHEKKYILSII